LLIQIAVGNAIGGDGGGFYSGCYIYERVVSTAKEQYLLWHATPSQVMPSHATPGTTRSVVATPLLCCILILYSTLSIRESSTNPTLPIPALERRLGLTVQEDPSCHAMRGQVFTSETMRACNKIRGTIPETCTHTHAHTHTQTHKHTNTQTHKHTNTQTLNHVTRAGVHDNTQRRHLPTHPFTHPLIHSLIHSLIHPSTHPLIHSTTHSLTR
jgi:hypothetical protein